jgi:hypothetical protein
MVEPRLRELFDKHPEIWRQYGDLARHSTEKLIRLVAGADLAMAESLVRSVDSLKARLAGDCAGPLEMLLIDRIAVTWLAVHWCESTHAQSTDASLRQTGYAEQRLDRAHRRHLSSIAALAALRKLLADQARVATGPGKRKASLKELSEAHIVAMPTRTMTEIDPGLRRSSGDICSADVSEAIRIQPLAGKMGDMPRGPGDVPGR